MTYPGYSVARAKQSLQAKIDVEARRAETSMHRVAIMQDFMNGKTIWWRPVSGSHPWKVARIDDEAFLFSDRYEYTTVHPVENLKLELDLTPAAALTLLACLNASRTIFECDLLPTVRKYGPDDPLPDDAVYTLLWEPLGGKLKAYLQSVPR